MNSEFEWRLARLWYGCGIALLFIVAVISLVPISVSVESGGDKLAHVLIYLVLSGWFSLIVARPGLLWRVFMGLIVYGFLMELLQGQTDYRSYEVADAVANSVGVALGLLARFTPLRRLLITIDSRLAGLSD